MLLREYDIGNDKQWTELCVCVCGDDVYEILVIMSRHAALGGTYRPTYIIDTTGEYGRTCTDCMTTCPSTVRH